ncbi:MAG: NAD(P)/FAD-dependent oxidoreductase [Bacteroidetes bacterium]|nr:NAD(P)/FAD-dependent oxidoreductase [Bacteroidota bacterium]
MDKVDVVVIGGGAAGFFGAINLAEMHQELKITIIERSDKLLSKVLISGGGRCNVTNGCWDPSELVLNYPRGQKELRGPFNKFCTGDTVDWFETHGVPLKIEDDNRMFPASNSSQTIIDCFLNLAKEYRIEIRTKTSFKGLNQLEDGLEVVTSQGKIKAQKVLVAAGSSPVIWNIFKSLGHTIVNPVPSLFTFNIRDGRIKNLPGLSVPLAKVSIPEIKMQAEGPLLITHWGMSGPAILKLSAFGARELAKLNYKTHIEINFTGLELEEVEHEFLNAVAIFPDKLIDNHAMFNIPKRLWKSLLNANVGKKMGHLNEKEIKGVLQAVTKAEFKVNGKSTFKDEFVTAGGIDLKEVDFRTMESKLIPNLYFAGEVLDIDAITGGFNFQAAWTTSYLAAQQLAKIP